MSLVTWYIYKNSFKKFFTTYDRYIEIFIKVAAFITVELISGFIQPSYDSWHYYPCWGWTIPRQFTYGQRCLLMP